MGRTPATAKSTHSVDEAPASAAKKTKARAKSAGTGDSEKGGEPPASDAEDEKKDPPLLEPGNPLRLARGGLTAFLGCVGAFVLMAHDGQLSFGVPLGALFIAVAAWGFLDLLGTFDDKDDRVEASMTLSALAPSLGRLAAGTLGFALTLFGGQSGAGPQWLWGILVTVAFLLWVGSVFQVGVKLGPWAKDELGNPRPLLKRHGFWVLAAGALLYLPALGIYSLWDPWETHYGEVAREILSRDDWISLWWAQDGWFWSKPILNFWIQSIAMATLRTHYHPDQMLVDGSGHATMHPEWVVRAPNVLFTLVAMYFIYKGVAKVFGRRAGLIGGLVLATAPDWYFLAHQTMTDMPCVASMTAAMGLLLLGLHTDENQVARVYEVKAGKTSWRFSGYHLVFGAILVVALPQILYLLSRNMELVLHGNGPKGFRPHWDEFYSGSKGNCGMPGNENCVLTNPASLPKNIQPHPEGFGPSMTRLFGAFEPVLQGLLWSILIGFALWLNWGERRLRRLFYLAAWFFAAVATMGKGPEGVVIPAMATLLYIVTKRRWSEFLKIEILSGLLIWAALVLPWFVAMYLRHGPPFTDRLIFHDMFNRALHHVHDTNEGDDTSLRFYVWQLGYALFPWTGLAPLGLVYWLRRSDSAEHGKADVAVFLFSWFLFAFFLVTFMGTKFHHYIFPAVPAVAMLVGVVLEQMLEGEEPMVQSSRATYLVGTFAGVLLVLAGVARTLPGSIFGTKELHGELATASIPLGVFMAAAGAVMIGAFVVLFRKNEALPGPSSTLPPPAGEDLRTSHERVMIGAAAVAGALALALVGRDLILKPEGSDQPGAIRLLQLFTYNYKRAWPESLDFSAILSAFTGIGVLALLGLASWKWRRHAAYLFVAVAAAWAFWGLDVYMVKTAPHWGQHEAIQAYYDRRTGPEEPLIAYQMNWKGENFYTGNHVPAFVSTGATFTNWLKSQREKGTKVMFFITEHSRIGGLKSEVQAKKYEEITDKVLNNKFVVVRAEL
ncbi:MAG TPA: glycosyltransferase family 39 protein [Polyangiaceae bacterium]|jgi:4-amino-4-deoxy-L-arabinose transferase-like glycosyltransferase